MRELMTSLAVGNSLLTASGFPMCGEYDIKNCVAMLIMDRESERRPIPPTGNTNTHGRFKPGLRAILKRWAAAGPTHHFALGVGHHADTLAALAGVLGVEAAIVTPGAVGEAGNV
jgi:L-arabinose isomerase